MIEMCAHRLPKVAAATLMLVAGLASLATARDRTVRPCSDVQADLTTLIHPVSRHAKSFDADRIQLLGIFQSEPVCCGAGVAVVMPDNKSETDDRKCLAVLGWSDVKVAEARSVAYDAKKGRLISIPVKEYQGAWGTLRLRINQATGTVTIE